MISRLQKLTNWHVFYILVFITLATSVGSAFLNPEQADSAWWSGFLQNFSTEMMGAIATFVLFELVIETRKREENKQEVIDKEKATLIVQMRSSDEVTVENALEQLRVNGWLEDGTLADEQLSAKYLTSANLSGARLTDANLSHTILVGTNLSGANLENANLSTSVLMKTNLSGANLRNANLFATFMMNTDLSGVDLLGAELKHTRLSDVICDENTILPDGTKWTEDVNWSTYEAVVIETGNENVAKSLINYIREHKLGRFD